MIRILKCALVEIKHAVISGAKFGLKYNRGWFIEYIEVSTNT